MNLGDVLYDNTLRNGTLTYSGTEAVGFEKENAVDWRDFSYFAPSTGSTNLDSALTAGQSVDTAVIWVSTLGSLTAFSVSYESSPGTFTTLATFSAVEGLQVVTFASVAVLSGRKVRVTFVDSGAGTGRVRQVTVGPRLTFPVGEWSGKTPHALRSGVVMDNVISVNGSIIGRNVRRTEKSGSIELDPVSESWVRTYWEPFTEHAVKYPFWYRWNPRDYPQDLIMAAAHDIVAPKNSGTPPFMSVNMPFKGRTP